MAIAFANAGHPVQDPTFCKGQSDIQSGLMVVTVAAAVLSLIPPCRFVGATIMRSAAVISSLDICQDNWRQNGTDWKKKAIMCAKVAATGLGLAAIAASSPALLIAALTTEIAVQIFEIITTTSLPKKLLQLGFLAVNITVLTGVILASWQLLLAASIVSVVGMTCLGLYIIILTEAETWKDVVNMACIFALAGVNIARCMIVFRVTFLAQFGKSPSGTIEEMPPYEYGQRKGWTLVDRREVDFDAFLDTKHYNTLPIGTHTVVAVERIE